MKTYNQSSKTNKNKTFFRLIFLSELFVIFFIQGLLGLQPAYATTYYVSPSGIDTNSGTLLSTPVKTINKALSKALSSGDIVYVISNSHYDQNLSDSRLGGPNDSAFRRTRPTVQHEIT